MDAFSEDVLFHAKKMWEYGLVVGSAGNVSRRIDTHRIAITPSGVPYEVMTLDDIVTVDVESGQATGSKRDPSYELPMHLGIYAALPGVAAIMHTHSPYVTTLSVMRRPLPPVIDEMVMYFGGAVEVADYAFTGTAEVGRNVVQALSDRTGALLANHGNVCVGRTLERALHAAIAMETAAKVYVQALALGEPKTLPADSIRRARAMYEQRR